jgi:plastocyanin
MTPQMRTGVVASLVVVVALLLYSAGHGSAAGPERSRREARPAEHTVTIDAVQFQPSAIEVKRGDSIIWINKDPFPHTVTSKTGHFDSQQIQPGESWTYKVQQQPGDIPYICSLHPTMKATVRVK